MYLSLRESIVKGEFSPGYRLLVLDIAGALGISQAPVREAMERLKQEGLLVSKPNKGSVVTEIRKEEIEEIYVLRELIEWNAVKTSLPLLLESDFEQLTHLYDQMLRSAEQDDLFGFIDQDMEFHGYFFAKAGNKTIEHVWEQMTVKMKRFLAITNKLYYPDLLSIARSHQPLIDSLIAGDEAEVERRFIGHMKDVWWHMRKNSNGTGNE